MSTKTTFKRVALVAVAALGLGVLTSVAPASAAANTNLACTVSYDAPAATAVSVGANISSDGVQVTYTLATANKFIVGQLVTITSGVPATANFTNATITAVTSSTITVTPKSTDIAVPAAGTITLTTAASVALGTENKTCKGLAGAANTVTVASTQATVREYLVLTGGTFSDGTTTKTIGTGAAVGTAVILTPAAGSISVTGYAETAAGSGVYSATATDSLTIVVAAAAAGTVYSASTTTIANGSNTTSRTVVDADAVKTYYASAAVALSTSAFDATVVQKDAAGIAVDNTLSKAVTATISGVGTLSMNNATAQGGYVAQSAATLATNVVSVFADGRAGTGTVSISVNGVVVKTFVVTFYGTVASYTVTTNTNYIPVGAAAAVFTVTALDANGVKVPGAAIIASSSSTSTATVDATQTTAAFACTTVSTSACTSAELAAMGKASFSMAGVAKGAVTVTFANAATSATVTATGKTMVTGSQAATITWAFDQTDYVIGQKGSVVFTLKDSDGNPVADGTYAIFAAAPTVSANVQFVTPLTVPAASIATVDGVAKWAFFAPVTSGSMGISGTLASGAALAASLRGVATSITATVSNTDSQAAADAAAEATDAANAATDAANAAAEAADAATAAAQDAADAVAALAAQVADMISALKKQITALTNLVIKIQKKVKA